MITQAEPNPGVAFDETRTVSRRPILEYYSESKKTLVATGQQCCWKNRVLRATPHKALLLQGIFAAPPFIDPQFLTRTTKFVARLLPPKS